MGKLRCLLKLLLKLNRQRVGEALEAKRRCQALQSLRVAAGETRELRLQAAKESSERGRRDGEVAEETIESRLSTTCLCGGGVTGEQAAESRLHTA